jgi:hypothetical protein
VEKAFVSYFAKKTESLMVKVGHEKAKFDLPCHGCNCYVIIVDGDARREFAGKAAIGALGLHRAVIVQIDIISKRKVKARYSCQFVFVDQGETDAIAYSYNGSDTSVDKVKIDKFIKSSAKLASYRKSLKTFAAVQGWMPDFHRALKMFSATNLRDGDQCSRERTNAWFDTLALNEYTVSTGNEILPKSILEYIDRNSSEDVGGGKRRRIESSTELQLEEDEEGKTEVSTLSNFIEV